MFEMLWIAPGSLYQIAKCPRCGVDELPWSATNGGVLPHQVPCYSGCKDVWLESCQDYTPGLLVTAHAVRPNLAVYETMGFDAQCMLLTGGLVIVPYGSPRAYEADPLFTDCPEKAVAAASAVYWPTKRHIKAVSETLSEDLLLAFRMGIDWRSRVIADLSE